MGKNIGIKNLNKIVQQLVQTTQPQAIYLFGSYASGKPNENSDLDFCIIKNQIKDKNTLLKNAYLSLYKLPYAFDLVMMTQDEFDQRKSVWWTLQGQIQEKGKKIYEAS